MILEVREAAVRYGRLKALDDVSLSVAAGERVALLGHNGAGKTTLMKAVLGLQPLAAGAIMIDGARPGSPQAREATAYLPENVAFHAALTGREALMLFARIRGAPREVPALIERVDLGGAADRRIGTYSKGMRQRLGLAQALLAKPRLALLDEPSSGLDPIGRAGFYDHVDALAADGAAVVISSHALTELEARTERIAILRRGRIVANDTLTELRRRAGLPIRVRVTTRPEAAPDVAMALGGTRVNGESVELSCAAEDKLAVLTRVTELATTIRDFDIAQPSLEDLYRHFSTEDRP